MAKTKQKFDGQVFLGNIAHAYRATFIGQSRLFYQVLAVVLFLVAFGAVMVLSSSSIDAITMGDNAFSYGIKQTGFAIFGLVCMFVAIRMSLEWIRKHIFSFWVFGVALQVATITFLGTSVGGNKNWIKLGGFSVQPSEILKLLMILLLAELFVKNSSEMEWNPKAWYRVLGISGVSIIVVILGGDMGTAMVMAGVLFGMAVFFGAPSKTATVTFVIGVFLAFAFSMSGGSRKARILAWMNPNDPDPLMLNWQQQHGFWAFAAGGVTGAGLGQSKLKWSWIPEAQNDFIFAIIGEELGLIGSIIVIGIILYLIYKLMRIAYEAKTIYSRLVAGGVMLWIGIQSVINIAVVVGFLPVLGVPLPLISYGGSSLVMLLISLGLVLGIERSTRLGPRSLA